MFVLWHKMMQKLYNWAMRVVAGPKAFKTLCAMAFAESSFFPIPPDILMIPLVLKRRTEAFKIAFWCTVWSVIGGQRPSNQVPEPAEPVRRPAGLPALV